MRNSLAILALGALPLSAYGSSVSAQSSLADRVAAAPAGRVQFTYAARPGVCGNGRTFFSSGGNSWYGSWNSDQREACIEGPMRVLLDRAGREIVAISSFAGPVQPGPEGTTDLGRVSTADAAGFLLGIAERSQGRVSRDAIMPAMLADSVDATPRLLAIARNRNSSRETRRTAISWLGRSTLERTRPVGEIASALVSVARDDYDNQSVRQSALRTLARLEHGAGTAPLMELARDEEGERSWLARESVTSLNASGDPRARAFLRELVGRAELHDDVLAAAIRGVGGGYATADDIKLLRDTYAKLPGNASRQAAVNAIATFGGSDNVRWLLALAANPDETGSTRTRAMQQAYRGGATVADIIRIYDESTDTQLKNSVMSTLMQSGEKAAVDKLMQIARNDDNASRRRRAISLLGRSSDARVREFLASIVR